MTKPEETEKQVENATEEAKPTADKEEVVSKEEAKDQDLAKNGELTKDDEIAKLKDELLRAKAETQNTRKRLEKDNEQSYRRGIERVVSGLVGIIDDLERAANSTNDNLNALKDGISMTLNKLKNDIKNHGMQAIEPKEGDAFDPNLHEPISHEETDKYEENRVVRIFSVGYRYQERILRPASVVVSKKKSTETTTNGENKNE